MSTTPVPESLRRWFLIHFVADLVFALPLFIAPTYVLSLLGWTSIDPVTTRLVAAALFGIGIQSLIGHRAGVEEFRPMLNLKIIWSSTALLGLIISALQGSPPMTWAFAGVFAAFHVVWVYYLLRLRAPSLSQGPAGPV